MSHRCYKKHDIVLYPEFTISSVSNQVFPLGMIAKNEKYEFGGGCSGTEDRQGVSLKILLNNRIMKIRINEIKNIIVKIFIERKDGNHVEYTLSNIFKETIRDKLIKGDIIYFGYIYNADEGLLPPIIDLKLGISKIHKK